MKMDVTAAVTQLGHCFTRIDDSRTKLIKQKETSESNAVMLPGTTTEAASLQLKRNPKEPSNVPQSTVSLVELRQAVLYNSRAS